MTRKRPTPIVPELDEDGGIRWAWDFVEPTERGSQVLVEQRVATDDDEHIEGTTLFVASTDSPDRAMDVVSQNWKLAAFRQNPVILDNHNYSRVVGRGMTATVPKKGKDAGKLMIRVEWDQESPDPSIRNVGHQHLKRFRSAGSVGFRAAKKTLRHKLPTDHQYYQEPIEVEGWFGKELYSGTLYESPELFEFSSATIPMNADALQRSFHTMVRRAEGDPAPAADPGAGDDAAPTDILEWLSDAGRRGQMLDALWPDAMVRLRDSLFPEDEDEEPEGEAPPADESLPAKAMRRLIRPGILDVLRSTEARRIVAAYPSRPTLTPTTTPSPGVLARVAAQILEKR